MDWCSVSGRLASASSDGTVRLWSAEGDEEQVIEESAVIVAWSPDGKRLALTDRASVRVVNPEGETKTLFTSGPAYCLSWSPDGRWLAVGFGYGVVRLISENGTRGPVVTTGIGSSPRVAWSPTSQEFATSGGDRGLQVWSVNGRLDRRLPSTHAKIWELAWNPDGTQLVAACGDQTARRWELDGQVRPALKGHSGSVRSVDWSRDGGLLATGSVDADTRIWKADGFPQRILKGHTKHVSSVAWSPVEDVLATTGGDPDGDGVALLLWNTEGEIQKTMPISPASWDEVAWSPSGEFIATAGRTNREIHLVKLDGTSDRILDAKGRFAQFSPDGQQLAVADYYNVALLNADGTKQRSSWKSKDIVAIGWAPSSNRLAVASSDDLIRIWNTEEASLVGTLQGALNQITTLAWSPKGNLLAVGNVQRQVVVWDATTREHKWCSLLLPDGRSLTFTPAGQNLSGAAASIDEELVCIVESDDGEIQLVKPSVFEARVGSAIRLTDNPDRTTESPTESILDLRFTFAKRSSPNHPPSKSPLVPVDSNRLSVTLKELARRVEQNTATDPKDPDVAKLYDDLIQHYHKTLGTDLTPNVAALLKQVPSPFDLLRREDIPEYELKVAGRGDPNDVPTEVVAILGDSRFKAWYGATHCLVSHDGEDGCSFRRRNTHHFRRRDRQTDSSYRWRYKCILRFSFDSRWHNPGVLPRKRNRNCRRFIRRAAEDFAWNIRHPCDIQR